MSVTVKIKRKGDLSMLMGKIMQGAQRGLEIGGKLMEEAVKVSVTDLARYPTGELAGTVKYESKDGSATEIVGRIVASGDHARWFEEGAAVHFVSINSVDWRVIGGLYENAIPVYEYPKSADGGKPKAAYDGISNAPDFREDIPPIGYLISSAPHPFMEQGFNATKDAVVREVANQIIAAVER